MDPPWSRFAVTAETQITVFHHRDGDTAQNNHVIALPFTRHYWPSKFNSIVPCLSILSPMSLSTQCQRPWADYKGMLMLIKWTLVKKHATYCAVISQMPLRTNEERRTADWLKQKFQLLYHWMNHRVCDQQANRQEVPKANSIFKLHKARGTVLKGLD